MVTHAKRARRPPALLQAESDQEVGENRKLQENVVCKDGPRHAQTSRDSPQTADHIGDFFRIHTLFYLNQPLAQSHFELKLTIVRSQQDLIFPTPQILGQTVLG